MANPVTVPRLGWSMDEGTFVEWLKRDGEEVRPGEPLFVLESEKASEPIEALDGGILRITAESPKAGDTVKVGQVLAYVVAEGETLNAVARDERAQPERAQPERASPVRGGSSPGDSPPLRGRLAPSNQLREIAVTPRARRAARELGIDAATIAGSGRNGRVRERDVLAATSTSGGRLIPHTRTRRTIAARMVAGVTQAAPVTLTTKVDATNLVAWRNRFKAGRDPAPGYSDLILDRTVQALQQHPMLQAQWREDGLWVPDHVHLALAVDTEAGLLAPVIRTAEQMTLVQRVLASRELIAKARAGRLAGEELRDGTFTVTNLGTFGIDAFTPIINLPQSAILGVGRIAREPAVVEDRIEPRDLLTLSLTFDHRVMDGAPAARFLQALSQLIARGEQP